MGNESDSIQEQGAGIHRASNVIGLLGLIIALATAAYIHQGDYAEIGRSARRVIGSGIAGSILAFLIGTIFFRKRKHWRSFLVSLSFVAIVSAQCWVALVSPESAQGGAAASALKWTSFSPPEHGFSVDFPAEPAHEIREELIEGDTFEIHVFKVIWQFPRTENICAYGVTHADYSKLFRQGMESISTFNRVRDEMVTRLNGTLLDEEILAESGYLGRVFKLRYEGDKTGVVKLAMKDGTQFYQIMALCDGGMETHQTTRRVLDSFR